MVLGPLLTQHSSSLDSQSPRPSALPDYHIDITDVFEDPPVDVAPPVAEDDSPTESESDDDAPIVLPLTVAPVRAPSPENTGFSLQSEFVGSTPDGCSSADSSGSSSGSVPAAVKAFYDMVGSGEGSYPDSFPESLKWTDQETQDYFHGSNYC